MEQLPDWYLLKIGMNLFKKLDDDFPSTNVVYLVDKNRKAPCCDSDDCYELYILYYEKNPFERMSAEIQQGVRDCFEDYYRMMDDGMITRHANDLEPLFEYGHQLTPEDLGNVLGENWEKVYTTSNPEAEEELYNQTITNLKEYLVEYPLF